jgi:hypothetical protein
MNVHGVWPAEVGRYQVIYFEENGVTHFTFIFLKLLTTLKNINIEYVKIWNYSFI